METKQQTKWGISSMVIGIVGILLVFAPYFGLPCSIIAIIEYGIQKKHGLNGFATAGLICGIIGTIINSITALIFIWFVL